MATNAIYSITSELNQPLLTENSPSTSAAITESGVLSMLGVLTAASLKPSMASSKIRNCQISGMFSVSFSVMNANFSGIHSVWFMRSRNVGVMIYVRIKIRNLVSRRYVPVMGGK